MPFKTGELSAGMMLASAIDALVIPVSPVCSPARPRPTDFGALPKPSWAGHCARL